MKVSEMQFLLGLCPQKTNIRIDIDGKTYYPTEIKPMVDLENGNMELYCRIYCKEKKSSDEI